jgi:hypothetical protein
MVQSGQFYVSMTSQHQPLLYSTPYKVPQVPKCTQITIAILGLHKSQGPGHPEDEWQNLIFASPQNKTCFITAIWHLEFSGGSYSFGKSVYR